MSDVSLTNLVVARNQRTLLGPLDCMMVGMDRQFLAISHQRDLGRGLYLYLFQMKFTSIGVHLY